MSVEIERERNCWRERAIKAELRLDCAKADAEALEARLAAVTAALDQIADAIEQFDGPHGRLITTGLERRILEMARAALEAQP